jgi:hypothetical protein
MVYLPNTKRSILFNGFNEDKQKEYFSLSLHKYYPHVDTYYYSIFLQGDNIKDDLPGVKGLLDIFMDFREKVKKAKEDIYFDKEKDLLYRSRRFEFYDHCLGVEELYDIFFCTSIPNSSTPRIVVQLRSIGLWTYGEYELINKSFVLVKELLEMYGLNIDKIQENRIDYAYHTNSIQNPVKFYGDKTLENNLVSTMSKYMKVGNINKVRHSNKNKITIDYFSLGQRKSNCIFFRTYNKVREVVEENYKEFFITLWYKEKLINYYDFFIYNYAYAKHNYDYIYWGMLEFYLQFGTDENIKNRFASIKANSKKFTIDHLKEFVLEVCPMPTLIVNIEFQTMRKYYFQGRHIIQSLSTSTKLEHEELLPLWQVLDNRSIFLKGLTSSTVSFRKNEYCSVPSDKCKESYYLDFWKRLRSVKLENTCDLKYVRKYSSEINIDVLVSKLKGLVASFSVLSGNLDSNLDDDLSATLTYLNDNDFIRKVYDDNKNYQYEDYDYDKIKEKKLKALKSVLGNSKPSKKINI